MCSSSNAVRVVCAFHLPALQTKLSFHLRPTCNQGLEGKSPEEIWRVCQWVILPASVPCLVCALVFSFLKKVQFVSAQFSLVATLNRRLFGSPPHLSGLGHDAEPKISPEGIALVYGGRCAGYQEFLPLIFEEVASNPTPTPDPPAFCRRSILAVELMGFNSSR